MYDSMHDKYVKNEFQALEFGLYQLGVSTRGGDWKKHFKIYF